MVTGYGDKGVTSKINKALDTSPRSQHGYHLSGQTSQLPHPEVNYFYLYFNCCTMHSLN